MVEYLNVHDRALFIGDNLDVLRGINTDAVDFVYLDPPRNSGITQKGGAKTRASKVSYEDTWTADDMRPEWTNEIGVRCPDALLAITAAKVLSGADLGGYMTFMALRLLELRRVLKPSGGIYLQSDPHVSHYLRALMDAIFGRENFRNEISWLRDRLVAGTKNWKWHHDAILFYAGPHTYRLHRINQEPAPDYWSNFIYEDDRGKFYTSPLVLRGPGRTYRDGSIWRSWAPGRDGRHWKPPMDLLVYLYPGERDLGGLSVQEQLERLYQKGMVVLPASNFGYPRFKRYDSISDGVLLQDVVTTIPSVRRGGEDVGWPEQKPEALVDLMIRVSTNPRDPKRPDSEAAKADIVLDPFCGSGTACLAAELAERRWIGIEQHPKAGEILKHRFRERGLPEPLVFTDTPWRTDLEEDPDRPSAEFERPNLISNELDYPGVRASLYERQDGRCMGCNHRMPQHSLLTDRLKTTDRIEHDSLDNLALVCLPCRAIRLEDSLDHLELTNRRNNTYDTGSG